MKVLVDTCVWSMALRRSQDPGGREVSELMELVKEFRVQLIGPVRQEILSGIKSHAHFHHGCGLYFIPAIPADQAPQSPS